MLQLSSQSLALARYVASNLTEQDKSCIRTSILLATAKVVDTETHGHGCGWRKLRKVIQTRKLASENKLRHARMLPPMEKLGSWGSWQTAATRLESDHGAIVISAVRAVNATQGRNDEPSPGEYVDAVTLALSHVPGLTVTWQSMKAVLGMTSAPSTKEERAAKKRDAFVKALNKIKDPEFLLAVASIATERRMGMSAEAHAPLASAAHASGTHYDVPGRMVAALDEARRLVDAILANHDGDEVEDDDDVEDDDATLAA